MGVRTALLAVTPITAEITAAQTAGQDVVGTLEFAVQKVADAINTLNALLDFMPAGANKTAITNQVTALT